MCSDGNLAAAEWLVATFGLTAADAQSGDNIAFCLACQNGHLDVAKWLVATFGLTAADARSGDNFALSLACLTGRLDVVKWLVATFALTAADARSVENSPPALACNNGHGGVAAWLLDTFSFTAADVRANGNKALRWACRNELDAVIVQRLAMLAAFGGDDPTCAICLGAPKATVCVPCAHSVACADCAARLPGAPRAQFAENLFWCWCACRAPRRRPRAAAPRVVRHTLICFVRQCDNTRRAISLLSRGHIFVQNLTPRGHKHSGRHMGSADSHVAGASLGGESSASAAPSEATALFVSPACVVCLEDAPTCEFMPCRHLAACAACATQIMAAARDQHRQATCPLCRTRTASVHVWAVQEDGRPVSMQGPLARPEVPIPPLHNNRPSFVPEMCVVCLAALSCVMFMPCGHVVVCAVCNARRRGAPCPTCRRQIMTTLLCPSLG
jgi:hypothetical protein